jgi:hypothetical protein
MAFFVLTVLGIPTAGPAADLALTAVFSVLVVATWRDGLRAPAAISVVMSVSAGSTFARERDGLRAPAAISVVMSVSAGSTFARDVYVEFVQPIATPATQVRVARCRLRSGHPGPPRCPRPRCQAGDTLADRRRGNAAPVAARRMADESADASRPFRAVSSAALGSGLGRRVRTAGGEIYVCMPSQS